MKAQENPQLEIQTCPAGAPAGRNDQVARQSHGIYSALYYENQWLFWQLILTAEQIQFRKTMKKAGGFVNAILVLIAVASVGLVFWETRTSPSLLFETSFWSGSLPSVNLFWFGMLALLYAIARMVRRHKELVPILHKNEWQAQAADDYGDVWATNSGKLRKQGHDISASFSMPAQRTIERAYRLAQQIHTTEVDEYHLLVSLLAEDEIQGILVRLGIHPDDVKKFASGFAQPNTAQGRYPQVGHDMVRLFFTAYIEAQQNHLDFVGLADLLIVVYRESAKFQEWLYDRGVNPRQMENVVAWVRISQKLREQRRRRQQAAKHRNKHGMDRAMTAVASPLLNTLSTDLTIRAMYGHVPQLVGRDAEVQSLYRVVQGGKQSVLLVGESGVGKEAIVEGLANKMVQEDVPPVLADKRLVQLSVAKLLAGATPAQAQERLLNALQEVRRAKNIILYVPNIEDMIGVTEGGGGSLDVAEVLARELERGNLFMLATTTSENYRKFVNNTAVANVFTKLDIDEMSVDQAIQVLEAKAGYIEHEHKVWFSYAAVEAAAALTDKLMHDDTLPRKGIQMLKEVAQEVASTRGKNTLVTKQDVAKVVSERSKVPITSVTEDESDKLLRLEQVMHQRLIGQEEAVEAVSNALRRARASLAGGERTIANFLFLGPTGVGKTELAKTVADVYFGSEEQMIRLDMSEYQDGATAIARLIGQPGQQGSGVLTEAIKQKPFALLLLDELEKADPNVLTLFLQLMDDGRLTDSVGRTIDATNIIMIATSNAGTQYVQDQLDANKPYEDIQEELLRGKLAEYYRPEFLNRFDSIVLFRALTQSQIQQIAGLMLKKIAKKLDEQGIVLQVDEDVLAKLAEAGFDPQFGARPMRRVMQDKVENAIAELLLAKKAGRGDVIHFSAQGVEVKQRNA